MRGPDYEIYYGAMQQQDGHHRSRTPFITSFRHYRPFALAIHFIFGLFLACAVSVKSALGSDQPWNTYDPDAEYRWKETGTTLPDFPRDENLVPVPMPSIYTVKVYMDEKSLSLGEDGVARFTLVVESPSKVRNVFHEGLRCDTREYKIYAFGTSDNLFEPMKQPRWERIPHHVINAYRSQLLHHYVCDPDSLATALGPKELIRRLKDTTGE